MLTSIYNHAISIIGEAMNFGKSLINQYADTYNSINSTQPKVEEKEQRLEFKMQDDQLTKLESGQHENIHPFFNTVIEDYTRQQSHIVYQIYKHLIGDKSTGISQEIIRKAMEKIIIFPADNQQIVKDSKIKSEIKNGVNIDPRTFQVSQQMQIIFSGRQEAINSIAANLSKQIPDPIREARRQLIQESQVTNIRELSKLPMGQTAWPIYMGIAVVEILSENQIQIIQQEIKDIIRAISGYCAVIYSQEAFDTVQSNKEITETQINHMIHCAKQI